MKSWKIPYWFLLFGPVSLYSIGFLMNKSVMAFNGGQMPFLPPGGCDAWDPDLNHVCMSAATHLNFLEDWFNLHGFIGSPGDFLVTGGEQSFWPALTAWCALMIRDSKDGNNAR